MANKNVIKERKVNGPITPYLVKDDPTKVESGDICKDLYVVYENECFNRIWTRNKDPFYFVCNKDVADGVLSKMPSLSRIVVKEKGTDRYVVLECIQEYDENKVGKIFAFPNDYTYGRALLIPSVFYENANDIYELTQEVIDIMDECQKCQSPVQSISLPDVIFDPNV